MQRDPLQKGNELLNEALQLRCGRNDCKQGILASQAKCHFFLWLKITWFLNVHTCTTVHVTFKSFRQYTLSKPFFLILVPCAGKIWHEKLSLRTLILLSKQQNDCKKCVLYLLSLQRTVTPFFAFVLQNEGNAFVAKSLVGCNLTTVGKVSEAVPISLDWTRILELFCRKTFNQKFSSVCDAGWTQFFLRQMVLSYIR